MFFAMKAHKKEILCKRLAEDSVIATGFKPVTG